jgi:AraC-like DNA-binding protein
MVTARASLPKPEIELYEFSEFLRYLEHGFPDPLVRWHYHDAYELHLIVATSGKLFVGDYIGDFAPGNVVLTGPRLPHNWITTEGEQVELRDMAIQFGHAPIELTAKYIPELKEVMPLLERSKYGVEFLDAGEHVRGALCRIRDLSGLERFAEFLKLITHLAQETSYRLLSSAQMQSFEDEVSLARINSVFNYILENYREEISAETLAAGLGMSQSKFSRFFRQATGNNFTAFVNHIRINKACHLLVNSDMYVANICYEVGFNNVANFNRRFLELKGMTPKAYRLQAQKRFGFKTG